MKRVLFAILLVMVMVLSGCGASQEPAGQAELENGVTVDITEENLAEVSGVLRDAGLSNVDVFESWVKEQLSGSSDSGNSTFNDADCRMTAMLLAGDGISYESVNEEYAGDYLMFDLDIINNQDGYGILKDKLKLFCTMFGEMPVPDGDLAKALPANWEEHGFKYDNPKASIVSLVFSTYETGEAFVGHTGILADCGDGYLFVEKIAFGDPFKVTKVEKPEDLIDIFSARPDYTTGEGEQGAIVYINDEELGQLG